MQVLRMRVLRTQVLPMPDRLTQVLLMRALRTRGWMRVSTRAIPMQGIPTPATAVDLEIFPLPSGEGEGEGELLRHSTREFQ
jgi:hypothetical protein